MADQIKAMMSALTVMEYDLHTASAAADLFRGCSGRNGGRNHDHHKA